ncbi:methylated-DNA--[protein]-cysteine S-methyltransferase [Cellulomonas edaphi]|uniref:Methylated-DNA--protein-cysteine methyltransferase n=1 Tax=Cellulomonas edaphi TaxID=3053468 RepID=A0ABT7S9W7_9CELL|nr:methylated-DNA--[protein]-cysteine S-methyltransferase [Cellulomons edaphi]MDM7831832.1 methylated-DNA--[protein]-cysteine S-methyltransferase [Cellulomons edaphi]
MRAGLVVDRAGATTTTHTVVSSPLGPVVLVAEDGMLSRVLLPDTRRAPELELFGERTDEGLQDAARQLAEYFAGERTVFDLPLHQVGSPFQLRVWAGLVTIPFGETRTYGQLAAQLGLDPRTTSRAVGSANGSNPLAIVVPCHRVIGADGTLTGYAAGVERKRFLLDLEGTRLF